ncbi:MAG: protein kinase domain-containing protein [Ktedonobacteraceae bacterium]
MQSEDNNELMSLIGKSLGQFRVVERLGMGGMSTVFKAYQPTLDRYVAVKVLPAYYAGDPMFVKRFTQEARSVAKLTHPNIVQIHDFGEQDAVFYIVMEYVDGGTLGGKLKQGALSVPDSVDFVIQAANGLEFAHLQGIVHRDVKPGNMLLRKDGRLLLSDFGIAKILEGTTELTSPGTLIGTPSYISPEQAKGEPTDHRSDIYSLGIVLFQCLTGRVPFVGDTPIAIIFKQLQEFLPVEYMRSMNIPVPIEQVVLKMTAKDPAERYSSAQGVIDALTEALAAAHLSLPRTRSGEQPQERSVSSAFPVDQQSPSQELLSDPTTYPESFEKVGALEHPSQPLQESPAPSTVLFTDASLSHVDLKDFFIIYNRTDRAWAKWIAWELDNAGYSAVLPAWSFQSDSDFELEMQKAAAKAHSTLIILSPDYLATLGDRSESVLLFRKEGINMRNRLLPICVRECGHEFGWLLDSIDYIDLVGEDESTARMILLAGVRDESIKLTTPPVFPGNTIQNAFDTEPGFPNRQMMQGRFGVENSDNPTHLTLPHPTYFVSGINVFFSYSHKDKKLRSELEKYLNHLKRQQLIVGWYDGEIEAGKEWEQEIHQHLNEAHIILLLISQDFMVSDYCYDIEMQKALERHETGKAHVIPIILRPAIWESSPIGKLQALPTGAKPIVMWSNKELAFMDVAKGIQKAIDKLNDR